MIMPTWLDRPLSGVNSGPIFLQMILSTIRTYNAKSVQIHRIDLESQQSIFPYKAKRQPIGLHFQLYNILNRLKHILSGLLEVVMHS